MKNDPSLSVLENGADQQAATPTKRLPIPKPKAVAKEKDRPTKALPSPRIAFEKQLDILRGYAAGSGPGHNPVSITEVADIVSVAESSFSLVNPFFCEIGLLQRIEQGGQAWKYLPCEDVFNFSKAYDWNRDTAAQKLSSVIRSSWFGDALLRKLAFDTLQEEEALATLAEKASAGPDYKPQLRLLLNYMESAGLVQREGGMIKMIKSSQDSTPAQDHHVPTHDSKESPAVSRSSTISTSFVQPMQGVVNFHVDVKINMEEFSKWSPERISSFFSGVAQVLAAKGAIEEKTSKDSN